MKNQDIITLIQAGVATVTACTLAPEHAYKVYRLKKAVKAAFGSITKEEGDILKEAGVTDAAAFNIRLGELRKKEAPSEEEKAELNALESSLGRVNELIAQMRSQEADLSAVKTIPYEQWHALQRENTASDGGSPLFGVVEELLEGVFWTPPKEEN